jgi:tRNA pseudouridine38-40 synthase
MPDTARKVKLIVQYDGTNYQGWQVQPSGPTIQGELTKVISMIDQRPVTIHGAGRTDSGVHAEGQVASFFLERDFGPRELRDAINGNIERDIRICSAEFVDDDFHARASAKSKTYRYDIWTGEVVSPFLYRYLYHHRSPLDLAQMRRAADFLVGTHDFSAFAGGHSDVDSTVRTLYTLDIDSIDNRLTIKACGNGFLKYMVRTIAGTLIEVGRGRRPADSLSVVLSSRDRGRAGQTAPAAGLTLVRVDY